MALRNEYRVLRDVTWTTKNLVVKENDAIIIERTEDGIIFLWSLFPRHLDDSVAFIENQDLNDYLVDGAWLTAEPWMYFDRLDDIMPLLNRQQIPLEYLDLGWMTSIREARAMTMVLLSLA